MVTLRDFPHDGTFFWVSNVMTPAFVGDDGGFFQKGWGFWFVPIIFGNGCRRKRIYTPEMVNTLRTRDPTEMVNKNVEMNEHGSFRKDVSAERCLI